MSDDENLLEMMQDARDDARAELAEAQNEILDLRGKLQDAQYCICENHNSDCDCFQYGYEQGAANAGVEAREEMSAENDEALTEIIEPINELLGPWSPDESHLKHKIRMLLWDLRSRT